MEKDLLPQINEQLGRWNRVALVLRVTHVSLALMGIVCPLIVASFADLLTVYTRILSFSAAVAVAVFSGFEIGRRATSFREAWKLLNVARLEYEQGIIDGKALIQAYREGEKTIGQLKSEPFGKEPNVG